MTSQRSDNLRGIALMVLAMGFFALGDMTIKWAADAMPPWARCCCFWAQVAGWSLRP